MNLSVWGATSRCKQAPSYMNRQRQLKS